MLRTHQLTGRTRVREEKRWFLPSLMVLQVEEEICYSQPYGQVHDRYWRDAKPDDLNLPNGDSNEAVRG